MNTDKNLVLISGAVLFSSKDHKLEWFIVKETGGDGWEIPKIAVRKGESSVRAALRLMGEKGLMTTRVIEEAGRAGGVTNMNGKTLPQRHIYYLMILKSLSKDAAGFGEFLWLDYSKAVRKISSKRERLILKQARDVYKEWRKQRKAKRKNNKT